MRIGMEESYKKAMDEIGQKMGVENTNNFFNSKRQAATLLLLPNKQNIFLPFSKICRRLHWTNVSTNLLRSKLYRSKFALSVNRKPSTHSMTSTFRVVRSEYTFGTKTSVTAAYSSLNLCALAAGGDKTKNKKKH